MKNSFVSLLALLYLSSCGIKQKKEAFPYSNPIRVDSLGCFTSGSKTSATLPLEPNNGSGLYVSSFDSDLLEGVGTTLANPVDCHSLGPTTPFQDPLVPCQWHLHNVGQGILSSGSTTVEGGKIGADLKLFKKMNNQTLVEKFSGRGYKVHISDSGIQDTHEDLVNNFNSQLSYDFCTGDNRPEPRPKEGEQNIRSDHGTSVAGIIAADANNKGGIGIVHEAKISADNAVSVCDITAENWPKTLKQGVDVWNGSFGTDTELVHEPNSGGYEIINDVIAGHIRDIASKEENPINPTAYFKAAGNEGNLQGNANRDPLGWNPWIAQIAAIDQFFTITGYSSPGSNILVSAFGAGEGSSPGVCTTLYDHKYGCDFNGTSAATPQAASVALMIKQAAAERGKILSPIDIYYILARTAIPVTESKELLSGVSNKKYINYSVNKAGYRHSVHYGFGVVNAQKAVTMAQDVHYDLLPPLKSYSNTSKDNCSDLKLETNKSCVVRKISFDLDFQIFSTRVSIDVKPNFDTFKDNKNIIGQVFAFLIQPDGTRSELMRTSSRITGSVYTHSQFFKSYAPFATNAKGDWYVEVCAKGTLGGEYYFHNANIRHYGFDGEFPLAEKK